MKKIVKLSSLLLFVIAVLFIGNFTFSAFSTPSTNPLTLPDSLVSLHSSAGKQLLAESHFIADYPLLMQHFESQSRRAFCGVASSVIVLNALFAPENHFTQSSFFTDAASEVRSDMSVTLGGMTLEQLGELLHAHGVEAAIYPASEYNLKTFRLIAKQNLQTPGDFLMVNYQRAVLGQGKTGHISPIAGYNAATDRFLILDVAAYKFPPVWVSADVLWSAMNTVDSSSRQTRGFIVVSKISDHG